VKSIVAGEQYSTILKDTRKPAEATAGMADTVLTQATGSSKGESVGRDLYARRPVSR
jgi:ABC-type xylose transport system substrate-binding protein